jgi:hypothetical protein
MPKAPTAAQIRAELARQKLAREAAAKKAAKKATPPLVTKARAEVAEFKRTTLSL